MLPINIDPILAQNKRLSVVVLGTWESGLKFTADAQQFAVGKDGVRHQVVMANVDGVGLGVMDILKKLDDTLIEISEAFAVQLKQADFHDFNPGTLQLQHANAIKEWLKDLMPLIQNTKANVVLIYNGSKPPACINYLGDVWTVDISGNLKQIVER